MSVPARSEAALSAPASSPAPADARGGQGTQGAGSAQSERAVLAMRRARTALLLDHPFFGTLALRLRLKEDAACADLWTDGRTLGFNPVYAATLPEEKLVGAQAHEIMHLALGHHLRRKNRDAALWNRACDLAVNHILLEAGFALPTGFAHDPAYAGMAVDDIYETLAALQDGPSKGEADKGAASEPGQEEASAGAMSFEGGKELGGRQDAASGGGLKGQKNGDEGQSAPSGTNAARREKRGSRVEEEGKTSFTGEVRDHPDAGGLENDHALRAAEQEADIALTQAMQRAQNMGSLPAGFTRLLKKEWLPSLDWRELLRLFLESCANSDYSWAAPNRRYLYQDIYLPARRESRLPHVVLAVDCSGSVDERTLAVFCAELGSVLDAYDTTLTVLFHDTRVQGELTFTRMDMPEALTPVGGGGTDFRPVCEHIGERDLHPTCLLWFTDLECSRFPPEPDYPVLWVCSAADPVPPPFGEVVVLPMEPPRPA